MKKLLFGLVFLLYNSLVMAQDPEIQKLRAEIEALKERVTLLEKIITSSSKLDTSNGVSAINSTNTVAKRCKAITQAGNQCSRNADPGSDYCWQHKKTYEKSGESSVSNSKSSSTTVKSSETTSSGRVIYTGPRGGRYYINSKGNKVYIKK